MLQQTYNRQISKRARQTEKTKVDETVCQQKVAVPRFAQARTVDWTLESVFG